MKFFGLIVALFITMSATCNDMFEHLVYPTPKDYDLRCVNMEEDHLLYRYYTYGKYFFCPEVEEAVTSGFQCMSVVTYDNEGKLMDVGILSQSFIVVEGVEIPDFVKENDEDDTRWFYYSALITDLNSFYLDKERSEQHPWGHYATIAFDHANGKLAVMPSICQIKK